jgi:3-hydroxyacyl-CoA dehydrogenase
MFWAGLEGLSKIVASLDAQGIEVSPLLRAKAEKGESF